MITMAIGSKRLGPFGRRMALALALAAALPTPAVSATVALTVARQDDAIVIEADAQLDSDVTTAWRVLTDYERYAEFLPGVRSSRVIARRGYEITVKQTGDATFWLMTAPVSITYQIVEDPPSQLRSLAESGPFATLASSYALTPSGDGVHLRYEGRIARSVELVGPLEANKQSIARQFRALVDEIERTSAGARRSRTGAS